MPDKFLPPAEGWDFSPYEEYLDDRTLMLCALILLALLGAGAGGLVALFILATLP